MGTPVLRFNKKDRPEFHRELNRRVNDYFKKNNLSKKANLNMKVKTVFMMALYFIPLGIILSGWITSFPGILTAYLIMGLGMTGIALSVMHDANHGAYSSNKKINTTLGYLINFIGGYHVTWKIQHNLLHHSFTNIHGLDEDLNQNVLRLSPDQERKSFFKYQAYYATFLYGLLTIYRFLVKDTQQLLRYNRTNILKEQGHNFKFTLIELFLTKSLYLLLTLILPIFILEIPWYQILAVYCIMHFITGIILALIFQSAHILEETDFYTPDENGSIENNWIIHEMRTTANFANNSTIFSWLIGGLNFQVEHHLFPHVCHVHYKDLSKIVKSTAVEYDIPYHEHATFFNALESHYAMLDKLGTGEYDRSRAVQVIK